MQRLSQLLRSIDGKGYKSYKSIQGSYQFDTCQLSIDHVQGDPFAAPSRLSLRVPMNQALFPPELWSVKPDHTNSTANIRKITLEDYLGRQASRTINRITKGHRGSGCSGMIAIETGGQQILQRNAIILDTEYVEARIVLGLPANGRRVAAQQAYEMLLEEVPAIVKKSLYYNALDSKDIKQHLDNAEDQHVLRNALQDNKLVAFIANDALLPRLTGIDDRPLRQNALPFQAPDSLTTSITLPNAGTVSGLGIPEGITLIVGGGFHGKSTLLHAIERGPYNHIPGDGREKVVTLPGAVKVRAEDGRSIANVNISPFIDRLPFNRDTVSFSTENASGSTSQAANIIEAIECGTQLLLIDEDTSATNFMIRDERMQALVSTDKEPITPLVARIRELYTQHGISSIIVMGGSGDYFDVADTVIMMDAYEPKDVTAEANGLSQKTTPLHADNNPFTLTSNRKPGPKTLNAARKNRDVKIDTKDKTTILYGEHRIDLSQVEQLIDVGQTRAIGKMIYYYATHYSAHNGKQTGSMIEGLNKLFEDIEKNGLDIISQHKVGNLAMPRLHELAAAINRIRNGDWQ